ncbi:MAG: hypothetical protein Q7S00_05460 [bacterium]|nr:hypothetical protein [bacterium]
MVVDMETAKKITTNIPEKLLKEAQAVTKAGITETLVEGLKILKRFRAWKKFQSLKGTLHLQIDLDQARERSRR